MSIRPCLHEYMTRYKLGLYFVRTVTSCPSVKKKKKKKSQLQRSVVILMALIWDLAKMHYNQTPSHCW